MSSIRATLKNITGQLSYEQWLRLSFYLGIPFLIGFYLAMVNLHSRGAVSYVGYVMFFVGHATIPFWLSCLSTQLVTILSAPWRWPLVIRLAAGGLIACFVVVPYASWLSAAGPVVDGRVGGSFQLFSQEFFLYSFRAMLIWIGINLLFDRILGLPRYRYPAVNIPSAAAIEPLIMDAASPGQVKINSVDAAGRVSGPAATLPAVLQLAPVPLQPDDLMAMEAQEHYVSLLTKHGQFLVYHRFADALKEVKLLPGIRVHRSHWIAESAIKCVNHSAKKMVVEVQGDGRIPVSRPYQAMVLAIAERRDIPVRGSLI